MAENLTASTTRFAFKLLRELAAATPRGSVFISPTSVAIALAMVWNGAHGETRRAMAKALELGGLSPEQVNRDYRALVRTLAEVGPAVSLTVANALWARADVPLRPAFTQAARELYDAEVNALDRNPATAAREINSWVQQKTHDKIDRIVDRISPSTLLLLLNAVYFKGSWEAQFDRQQTREGPFTGADGQVKQLPMMSRSGTFDYHAGGAAEAISLPYAGGRLSMVILLPARGSALPALLSELDEASWARRTRALRRSEGTLVVPRFTLRYEATLNDALTALGMGIAFDQARADFSELIASNQRANIDEVRHKTFVDVNEEGTEAAAVTSVAVTLASFGPPKRFRMVVDRPFVCAIRDAQTGALLFLGAIGDL